MPPVLFVTPEGEARPYLLVADRPKVGPVLSLVDGLPVFSLFLSLSEIKNLVVPRRVYFQEQLTKGS